MNKIILQRFALSCALVALPLVSAIAEDTAKSVPGITSGHGIEKAFCRFVPERLDDFAWENDRIAFRMYGPKMWTIPSKRCSSGIDVWVKKVRYPIINKWYKRGNYHRDEGEGADLYSVGKTLGCGGVGFLVGDKLQVNRHYQHYKVIQGEGDRIEFELSYAPLEINGATVTETKNFRMETGSNLFSVRNSFKISGGGAVTAAVGIVLRDGDDALQHGKNWIGYAEPESPNDGRTYCGVVLETPAEFKKTDGHALLLVPVKDGDTLTYHAGAAWSKGLDFKSTAEWMAYVKRHAASAAGEAKNGKLSGGDVYIEVENMKGPWKTDDYKYKGYRGESYAASPYSLAASEPIPMVANIEIEREGDYSVWVRALKGGSHQDRALNVEVAGDRLQPTHVGKGPAGGEFSWEKAGTIKLAAGAIELKVHPVGKRHPTADAIVLTQNPDWDPAVAFAPPPPPHYFAEVDLTKGETSEYFRDWPAGKSPAEIGKKVSQNFLTRGHYQKFKVVVYPEICTWYGAFRVARQTGDNALAEQLVRRFDPYLNKKNAKGFPSKFHVDFCVHGVVPLEMYRLTKDEKYLKLGMQRADFQWQKTTPDGITEQARYWVDDIYMIAAIQTGAYRVTGEMKYLDRPALTTASYLDKLQQPDGLFFHAADSPFYWGRGVGWFAAGMTEILRALPKDHPHYARIMQGYQSMMATLLKYQSEAGLWRQLVDKPESWGETSSTGMFAYAIVTGIKRGWLDEKTYGPVARKAWLALVDNLDENYNLKNVCVGTNKAAKMVGKDLKKQHQYYLDRPRTTGDYHGQAALLWTAAALLEPLSE